MPESVVNLIAIAGMAQRYINENPVPGMTLRVLAEGIRDEGDWTYVPVMPDQQPARLFAYYEALAMIETLIQREQGKTILLVPVTPEEPALVTAA